MSDEKALLAAIWEHPHEDTPRLMYADWLDEHGQPERAEFIRETQNVHAGNSGFVVIGAQVFLNEILQQWIANEHQAGEREGQGISLDKMKSTPKSPRRRHFRASTFPILSTSC